MTASTQTCESGDLGTLLPLITAELDQSLPRWLRMVLYPLALAWLFLGVAIISDVFMSAIERITAKKKRKLNSTTGRYVTVLVWNSTVANLTLMALGSSAPEILLSVIEVFQQNFFSGQLGPSTVVGSAAFNLLIISAVCVSAIPEGDMRVIKEYNAYLITVFFSIFAYLWLLYILRVKSPNIVEPWEGVFTFLFFPLLVIVAYAADKGFFVSECLQIPEGSLISMDMTKEELAALDAEIRSRHGVDLTEEQVMKIIEVNHCAKASRAKYRIAATRSLTGGRKIQLPMLPKFARNRLCAGTFTKVIPHDCEDGRGPGFDSFDKDFESVNEAVAPNDGFAYIEFETAKCAVLENVGTMSMTVRRTGNRHVAAAVRYRTLEGTAKAIEDFIPIDNILEFKPGELEKSIAVQIVNDTAYEEDEEFYIELSEAVDHENARNTVINRRRLATVLIIDDDLPGVLGFPSDEIRIQESDEEVEIIIERRSGGTGKVGCKYRTENHSAIAGLDYEAVQGSVEFGPGTLNDTIRLLIKPRGRYENTSMFRIILSDAFGGAKFDHNSDGGKDSCILSVIIEADRKAKDRVDKVMNNLRVYWDRCKIGNENWKDQFKDAMLVSGDSGGGDEPTVWEWCMHLVALPWKVLFAFVPPTDFYGGWACFFCSLTVIGFMSALTGDLAKMLGCVFGIPDEVTAITFVALGTSLPDTFASKTAALQESTADASLCNITGSNSVNVFLGLGLPWMIAAVYWKVTGPNERWNQLYAQEPWAQDFLQGAFAVKAGNLSFSVAVYSCCSIVALAVLYMRRRFLGGELGGPTVAKWVTSGFFALLWFGYVLMSATYIMNQ